MTDERVREELLERESKLWWRGVALRRRRLLPREQWTPAVPAAPIDRSGSSPAFEFLLYTYGTYMQGSICI